MVKAVIFDCFGVLTTDLWKEFVATLPEEQVQRARDLNYEYDSGRLSREEFRDAIKQLTGRKPQEVEKLLSGQANKNAELLSYIAGLKANYKVGMLSNIASDWVRQEFLEESEQQQFDTMVFSHEVGMAKPDPRIFELTAEKLGVKPAECVFIDDSEGHVRGAEEVGMRGILYENFGQMKRELEAILADSKN